MFTIREAIAIIKGDPRVEHDEHLDPENVGWNTHGAFEDKFGMSQEQYKKRLAAGKRPRDARPDIKLAKDKKPNYLGFTQHKADPRQVPKLADTFPGDVKKGAIKQLHHDEI